VVRHKQAGDRIDSVIVQIGRDLEGDRHMAAVDLCELPLFTLEDAEQGGERCFVLQGAQSGVLGEEMFSVT